MELNINNVINITIEQTPSGLGIPNANNLMLLTTEAPINLEVFGDYVSPSAVAANYGTNSVTSQMANAIFGQTPNPLSGDGQLIIAPFKGAVSATHGHFVSTNISANLANLIAVTNGDLSVTLNGTETQLISQLNFSNCILLSDVANVIQAALIDCIVTATTTQLTITSNKLGTSSSVVLATNAAGGVDLTGATLLNSAAGTDTAGANSTGETIAAAVARLLPQAFFAGLITNLKIEDTAFLAVANAIQPQDIIFLHEVASTTDIAGIMTTIQQASLTKTRVLPYFTGGVNAANIYKASYAGRGFSMDFTGSNTSFTMHLKQLVGVVPDANMTQTLLEACEIAGGDPYVSIQGYPCIFSTGGNNYFDMMYQFYLGFKFAAVTNMFNYLAQTNTKVPQTEPGMAGLRDSLIQINKQFVNNGTIAPGSWNSPETFGDPQTFLNNIESNGYYVYSAPIAGQTSAARIARQAPLVQDAVKAAGAIQSANVIVVINP